MPFLGYFPYSTRLLFYLRQERQYNTFLYKWPFFKTLRIHGIKRKPYKPYMILKAYNLNFKS